MSAKTKNVSSQKMDERNRSIAIVACLDAKQAFELYSYRIIDHDGFIEKMAEIGGILSQLTLPGNE